jgi:DNA-binding NtrC family response regulator
MNAPLRILVLDDYSGSARVVVGGALQLISDIQSSPNDTWPVTLPGGVFREIHLTFVEKAREAEVLIIQNELDEFDVVLLDNRWDGTPQQGSFGLDLLRRRKAAGRHHDYIALFTADAPNPETILKALECGASALVKKGERIHLLNVILASTLTSRVRRARQLEDKLEKSLAEFDSRLVTASEPMRASLIDAAAYAVHDTLPILIVGETGTGKEVVSRAIHLASPRSGGPFEILHSSAIPEQLAESELFGHEKGSFTGATRDKKGILRRAHGGTLFLDEIQDISLEVQKKLLRVLDNSAFYPVGSEQSFTVNIRLISATNGDPADLLARGVLREDFYQRIAYGVVRLPPLRDRPQDIGTLVKYFANEFQNGNGEPRLFSERALAKLRSHHWPFNVRELRATIFRTLAKTTTKSPIEDGDLEFDHASVESRAVSQMGLPVHAALTLLRVSPSKGAAKAIVEALAASYPNAVPFAQLNELVGRTEAAVDTPDRLLQTKISQIRSSLKDSGFQIEIDNQRSGFDGGYKLLYSPGHDS